MKPVRDEMRLRSRCLEAAQRPPGDRTTEDVAALMQLVLRAPGLRNLNRDVMSELCRCAFTLEIVHEHDVLFVDGEGEREPFMFVVVYGRVSTWCAPRVSALRSLGQLQQLARAPPPTPGCAGVALPKARP